MSSLHYCPSAAWFAVEVVLSLISLNLLTNPAEFGFTQTAPLPGSAIAAEIAIADFCIEQPLCDL